jgi:hypothetical protein
MCGFNCPSMLPVFRGDEHKDISPLSKFCASVFSTRRDDMDVGALPDQLHLWQACAGRSTDLLDIVKQFHQVADLNVFERAHGILDLLG